MIELVVVIAIIGVLAAILVPSMLNYVKKARIKAANSNAKTAYNAVCNFIVDNESKGIDEDEVIGYFGDDEIDCTKSATGTGKTAEAQQAVIEALNQNGITAGVVWVGEAEINNHNSYYVQWSGDNDPSADGAIFGQYPDAIEWDDYLSEAGVKWQSFNSHSS